MSECFLLRSQAMGIIQIKTIWSMTFIKNICAHNCAMLVYAYMGGGGEGFFVTYFKYVVYILTIQH